MSMITFLEEDYLTDLFSKKILKSRKGYQKEFIMIIGAMKYACVPTDIPDFNKMGCGLDYLGKELFVQMRNGDRVVYYLEKRNEVDRDVICIHVVKIIEEGVSND